MKMKLKGCKEQDILSLLELFSKNSVSIEQAFSELSKAESEVKKLGTGRMDIGKVQSPQKSSSSKMGDK